MTLPTVMTTAGLSPQSPASLLAQLLAAVAVTNPDYTANLPASLIEDVSSTDVGAVVIIDQARVETVNSLTPFGANAFILNQLGQIYGVQLGVNNNTSVNVVFTGTPGFIVAAGWVVSDGTNQYTTQDPVIIATGGSSPAVFALAVNAGSFAVPANTVTTLVTQAPTGITLSVTNPLAGVPGEGVETENDYRTRVLQAGLAASQGMPRYLKTLLGNVAGVQTNLISVLQQPTGFEVICGGGDPNEVALAIYQATFDITVLVGSTLAVTAITQANPMVVTTNLNHGYTTGQVASLAGVTPSSYNFTNQTVTVISEKTFSVPINSTGFAAYSIGGVVTPNLRNTTATIIDFPDTYQVTYVTPPQQAVTMSVTWNTTASNFTNGVAIQQLAAPALAVYVNALPVGTPMNLFELQAVFQTAVASVLSGALLTRLVFSVSINSVVTAPTLGTGIIAGDPESYFFTPISGSGVTITQG